MEIHSELQKNNLIIILRKDYMHTFKYKVHMTNCYGNSEEVQISAMTIKNDGYFLIFEDKEKVVAMFSKHSVMKVTIL